MTDTSLSIRLDTTQIRTGIADLNSLDQSSLRAQAALRQMGDTTSTASQRMIAGMSGAASAAQISARATAEATGSMTAGMSSTATATQLAAQRMSASLSGMASTSRASMSAMTESIMLNMQQMNASISQLVSGLQQSQSGIRAASEAAGDSTTRLRNSLDGTNQTLTGFSSLIGIAAGAIAGFGASVLTGEILQTNREMQTLRTSLETVTGSATNATSAFARIQEFAVATPYSVKEVTDAFIKLKSLGLTPSEQALTSYGNTASAMGKSLNQMIEAVADAATGEFERLKEFGIRSKREGDNVAFTFQNVTTTVKNSSGEIQDYLQKIGNVNFAGGMDRQAKTIDGTLSSLGDSWDKFIDHILNERSEGAIARWVTSATNALDGLDKWLNGASTTKGKIQEINEEINKAQKSLMANQNNGMIGGLIDDLTGYDPSKKQREIDSLVKSRQALVETLKAENESYAKNIAAAVDLDKKSSDKVDIEQRYTTALQGTYKQQIINAAEAAKINSNAMLALAALETNSGKNIAVSSAGAQGLMQIMPRTANALSERTGFSPDKILHDNQANIIASAALIKEIEGQLKAAGHLTIENVAAAYNAGMPALVRAGYDIRKMSQETIDYASNAGKLVSKFEGISGGEKDKYATIASQAKQAKEETFQAVTAAEKYQEAQDKNNAALAKGIISQQGWVALTNQADDAFYKSSKTIKQAVTATEKYAEALAKADQYMQSGGSQEGWVQLVNDADDAYMRATGSSDDLVASLKAQAKAQAELAGLEQSLINTSALVDMAEKLKLSGATTEEIKKQIDLQQQVDKLKAKNPLIDESKAKSLIEENATAAKELDSLIGKSATATETAYKRAQENIQDGFATMFENMLNGDALASFDKFIDNITRAFNKAIAQDFSKALGTLFGEGATDWSGIFTGVVASGASMLVSWLSESPNKATPTVAQSTTNKNIYGQAQMAIADTGGRGTYMASSLESVQRFNSMLDTASSLVRQYSGQITSYAQEFMSTLVSDIWGSVGTKAIDNVTNYLSSAYDSLSNMGSTLMGGVKSMLASAYDYVSSAVSGAYNAVVSGVTTTTTAATAASSSAASSAASSATSAASSTGTLMSVAGQVLAIVKLGYDLYEIAGQKYSTTIEKVSQSLSAASLTALAIPVLGWIVASALQAASGVVEIIGGEIGRGLSSLFGGHLGSLIFDSFFKKDPSATILSHTTPDANARTIKDSAGDYVVSSGGKSGTVGIQTAFGMLDMRINEVSKNSGLMIDEAVKSFLPLIRTVKIFDDALAASIREVDKTFGQDTMGKFKIKSEHEMDLSGLDTSKLLTQRLTDITQTLGATGTKAGEAVNVWFNAFSQKLLKPGAENAQYNTSTIFNIESFLALELPKLVELPKKLADLFVSSVKSVADGATQEQFTGQMNDFFAGWETAKYGLQKIGIEIQDTALPDYLTSLVGIGMTVKQSAESLVVFAGTFDAEAGNVTAAFNAAFDKIFSNAKEHAYTKEQTSGYVGSYITLANTAKDTGLSVTSDELNTLANSLNAAAIKATDTADGVIDQAIATANLANISRDAAIQQLALAGTLTSEQIAAADFGKALVEQQKTMLEGIEFANQNAIFLGTSLSNMGLTFTDVANIGTNITGTFKDMAEAMTFLDSVYKNAFSATDYAAGKKAQASATFDTSAKALGLKNYTTDEFAGWVRQTGDTSYTAELLRAEAKGNTARATALRNLGTAYNVLTQAETTYTESVKTTTQAVDDSADKQKALADIYKDVNEQILRLKSSDVANGILDINNAIQTLIDNAAENGGTIPNIEELRSAKLGAYARSLSDPIDQAFKELGNNQINTIAKESAASIKTINDMLANGLITFAESANLTSKVMAISMAKVKSAFQSVNDAFSDIGKTDMQKQIATINSERKANNDLARTWLYTMGGGRNASDENMAIYDGQVDRNNAVAASKTQAVFKSLIDEFNNIGKTGFVKAADDIKTWHNEAVLVAGDIADAYGTTKEDVIAGLGEIAIARAKVTFKPLLDEFNAIGKTDYQKSIAGINDWFNDTLKSVGDIALTYKISTEEAKAGIIAIRNARLDALQKENVAATKKISTDASRLYDTDFEKTINGIADTFSASIIQLASSGGTYTQIMTQYNAAIATGAKAYKDAQKVIRDAYTANFKTIDDVRNTLSDKLLLAKGSIAPMITSASGGKSIAELQDAANKTALEDAQKTVDNAQKARALNELNSTDFNTQISAMNKLIELQNTKYSSELTFIKGIASWIDKTKLSENLNPISNEARLAEAKAQYEKTLAGAVAGDQTSKDNLTSAMDTFLTESRSYNGVSDQYFKDYNAVMASAKGFAGDTTQNRVNAATLQTVTELQSLQDQLDKIYQKQSDKQHADLMKLDTSLGAIKASFDKTINEDPNVKQAFALDASFKNLGDDFKAILTATFDDIKKLFERGNLQPTDIATINKAYENVRDSLVEVANTITFSPALKSALSTSLGVATTSIQATVNSATIPDNLRVGVINGVNDSVTGFMSVAKSATFTDAQKTTIGGAYQSMWQGVNTVINNATATTAQKQQALSVINNASVGLGELIKSGTVSKADITKLSGVVSTAMQGQATDWTEFFKGTQFDEPTKAAIMGAVGDIGTSVIGIGNTAAAVINAVPVDNSSVANAVSGLMSSVASSVSAAASGVQSVLTVAQSNVNDTIAQFNMAYSGGNYDAAARIAKSAGYSNEDIANYVHNTFGGNVSDTLSYLQVKGYATGGDPTAEYFIAGEAGKELIANGKNSRVFNASQTRDILSGKGDNKEVVEAINNSAGANKEAINKLIMANGSGQNEMLQELQQLKQEFEKLKRELAVANK